jgi:hypothetical protein
VSWAVVNKQRPQVGTICMEIESLAADLRDYPLEFISDLEGIKEWCDMKIRNAKQKMEPVR